MCATLQCQRRHNIVFVRFCYVTNERLTLIFIAFKIIKIMHSIFLILPQNVNMYKLYELFAIK